MHISGHKPSAFFLFSGSSVTSVAKAFPSFSVSLCLCGYNVNQEQS